MSELKIFIKDNMPKGKTLTKMASQLNVTQPTISNWLSRKKIPTKYLFDVADYTETNPRELRKLMKFEGAKDEANN